MSQNKNTCNLTGVFIWRSAKREENIIKCTFCIFYCLRKLCRRIWQQVAAEYTCPSFFDTMKHMGVQKKINNALERVTSKNYDKSLLQVLVYSDNYELNIKKSNIDPSQPFHVASIGKMFTATLIGMLADKKRLRIEDKISKYLSKEVLAGLFVYNGTDYKNEITIRALLGHTSGIADYFESDVNAGSKFVEKIQDYPEKKWSPKELLDFTRSNQKTLSAPGEFHYSDTGYILLGLIIEHVTRKSFATILDEMIFQPLKMRDSYLMFYKKTDKEIAPIWFNNKEISKLNLLSCDWAGGGIVSTLDDLLKFQKTYWKGELVSSSFMDEMSSTSNKFEPGIHYGLGMMELRFEEFFFLLRALPKPKGHIGILGTFMFYDTENDLHFILNLGSNKKIPYGIRLLIKIESIIKKS